MRAWGPIGALRTSATQMASAVPVSTGVADPVAVGPTIVEPLKTGT